MDLTWEEPRHTNVGGGRSQHWREVAQGLQDNPGSWALILEKDNNRSASMVASQMRRGFYTSFKPTDQFEIVANGTKVYARWVG